MALDQSALTELLDALRAGGDLDFMREAMQLVLQALIELEADRGDRRRPLRAHRHPHHPPQRQPRPAAVDQGRRRRAGHPQAAPRQLLPRPAGAPPAHRPGPVGGDHGGVRARRVDPQGRRPRRRPGHRRRRVEEPGVAASAPSSTSRWPSSGSGASTTSSSPTCSSTPPTSRPTRAPGSCPRPSWWPPASPPTATGRCWAWPSATARTRRSGRRSCARCAPGASAGCAWSSPTPTRGCGRPSRR